MKRMVFVLAGTLLLVLAGCSRDPKVIAKKYIETGNKYFASGKYKEASIMYRRALQRNMRDGEAYYRLALVQLKMGMGGEARRSLLRATDLDSKNADAMARLGDIDMAIYESDRITFKSYLNDVNDLAKKLLARDPKSYDGLRLTAFVMAANKDLPGAIQKGLEANQVKPDQPELVTWLVKLLYANNQPQQAEQMARQLIDKRKDYGPIYDYLYMRYASENRVADAEEILKKKVANNPRNGHDLAQLAFHYYLTKRPLDMEAALQKLTSDPKTFPDGDLIAGDLMMRMGAPDRALTYFQQGEKNDSKNKSVYYKREVQALTREGKNSEAEKVVNVLLKDNPKDVDAITMHASLLVQSGDQKKIQTAIDELQRLVQSTPANQASALEAEHFNLALAYRAKGDAASLDQARDHLQETLKISNDNQAARLALAELEITRGDSGKALQDADKVIARMPNTLAPRLLRARALMNMGERQRARQELTALAQAAPRSNDVRYQLALLDLIEGKYKDAEAGFDALMKAHDARGLNGMIETKAREGDFNGAIELVRSRIQQSPNDMDLHRLVADLDVRAKRPNDAVAEYRIVAQSQPTAENFTRLGDYQQIAGQTDAALQSYTKATTLKSNDAMPLVRMAILYENSGRTEDARKTYDQVLKLQPDNPYALNNIAYVKAEQGVDLDQALTYAERAQQKLPNDPNVSDTVGLIYLRKNMVEDSVRVLGDLVKRAPERSAYHLHYAAALVQKGDKAAARRELDAASRTGPTEQEKVRIEELRRKLSS